jgi:predicted RNA methylase
VGKHGAEYERVDRDHYPTPAWVAGALALWVPVKDKVIWEPAAGDGRLARALRSHGAKVIGTDIVRGRDFLDGGQGAPRCDLIVTNPPFGPRGTTAVRFANVGLDHLDARRCSVLALLLPADFDSAKSRHHMFRDCRAFAAKIVLTRRIIWFQRTDGEREAPKENHAWYVWTRPAQPGRPSLLYAP